MKILLVAALLLVSAVSTPPALSAPPTQKAPAPKAPVRASTAEERYAAKITAIRANWLQAGQKFYQEFYAKDSPVDSPSLRAALGSLRRQNRRFTQIAPVPVSVRAAQAKMQAGMSKFEMALQENELYLRNRKDAHLKKAEMLNNQAATLLEAAQQLLSQTLNATGAKQRPLAATNDPMRAANPTRQAATSTPTPLVATPTPQPMRRRFRGLV